MEEGRGQHDWNQTASLLSALHNIHRGKARPAKPDEFNPYAEKKKVSMKAKIAGIRPQLERLEKQNAKR